MGTGQIDAYILQAAPATCHLPTGQVAMHNAMGMQVTHAGCNLQRSVHDYWDADFATGCLKPSMCHGILRDDKPFSINLVGSSGLW